MKNVSTIAGPDAIFGEVPNETLASYLLRGTAIRICVNIPRWAVIRRHDMGANLALHFGGVHMSAIEARTGVMLAGPLVILFQALLKLLGVKNPDPFDQDQVVASADIDTVNAAETELAELSELSRYWTHAIAHMMSSHKAKRAKGQRIVAPDWYIWLGRFGVTIKPSRLRAIMAALSVKGWVVVCNLLSCRKAKGSSGNTTGLIFDANGIPCNAIMPRCRDPASLSI